MVDRLPSGFVIDESPPGLPPGFAIDPPQADGPPVRTVDALTRAALDRVASNLLSIPSIAEGLGRQGLQSLGLDVSGETAIPRGSVAPVRALGQMGESALEKIKEGDIPGAFQAATSFDPALARVEAEAARLRQRAPGATQVGEVVGDVSSLLLAGRPAIRGAGRGVQAAAGVVGRTGAQAFPRITKALETARSKPGLVKVVDEALKSQFAGRVGGGVVRAAETGLEGVTLAILDEGDPLTTGLASAGFQAGGSLSRDVLRRIGSKGIGAGIMGSAMTIFLLQNFIPGGKNFVTEAFELSRDKFSLAVLAGAGAAMLGTGRPGAGAISRNFPRIASEFRAAVRGGVIDSVRELAGNRESGNLVPEMVLSRMTRDPSFFGPGVVKKIGESIRDRRKSVTSTIDRMIRDDTAFRRKVESLDPVLAGPEIPAPTGPPPTGRPAQFPMLVP